VSEKSIHNPPPTLGSITRSMLVFVWIAPLALLIGLFNWRRADDVGEAFKICVRAFAELGQINLLDNEMLHEFKNKIQAIVAQRDAAIALANRLQKPHMKITIRHPA
jgi:hypothetical protein